VTLTTPIAGQFVIPRLAFDTFYMHTKFGDSRFSRSGDMIANIENWSCDPHHAPFRGWFVIHRLGFDTCYLFAKSDDIALEISEISI